MAASQRDNAACLSDVEKLLCHVLEAPIVEGLKSIYDQAVEITQNNTAETMQVVDVFTALLLEIRTWSQTLLDEEVKRITTTRIPYLKLLLTALFVLKVKVLACVNMRADNGDFTVTVPSNATFIHQVYLQNAAILIENKESMMRMNPLELKPIVREGILRACYECIDWSDFLKWALDGVSPADIVEHLKNSPASGDTDYTNTNMDSDGGDNLNNDSSADNNEGAEDGNDGTGEDNANLFDDSSKHVGGDGMASDASPVDTGFGGDDDNADDEEENDEDEKPLFATSSAPVPPSTTQQQFQQQPQQPQHPQQQPYQPQQMQQQMQPRQQAPGAPAHDAAAPFF